MRIFFNKIKKDFTISYLFSNYIIFFKIYITNIDNKGMKAVF